MALTISVNTDGIKRAVRELNGLRRDLGDKAVAAALNRTADKARVERRRAITDGCDRRASEVNARLSVRGASARSGTLVAVLEALSGSRRGRAMNVIKFLRRRVTIGQARKGKQLGFRFKRGGPVKQIAGAFVGNQGRTVFVREGLPRLPIRAVQVIDVPGMFNAKRINARVVRKIERDFPVEFERAAKLFVDRFNRA